MECLRSSNHKLGPLKYWVRQWELGQPIIVVHLVLRQENQSAYKKFFLWLEQWQ